MGKRWSGSLRVSWACWWRNLSWLSCSTQICFPNDAFIWIWSRLQMLRKLKNCFVRIILVPWSVIRQIIRQIFYLWKCSDLKIVAVDCGRGKQWGIVCYRQGIRRWPDFRFFKNGVSVDEWDGDQMEVEDFVNHITLLISEKDEL